MVIARSLPQYQNMLREEISQSVPFDSEASLIKVVLHKLSQLFTTDRIIASSTEVQVGAGTVDIITGHSQENNVRKHKSVAISGKEAVVLSKLHYKQRLTAQTIAHRANIQLPDMGAILMGLCEKELVIPSGRCYVRATSPFTGLTAIEGKLKNWRKALQQAHRNRLFCTQSFVALDARHARPALQNIALFKQYRVGLALVFRDADVRIIYLPSKSQPLAPVMSIMAEMALLGHIM